MILSMYRKILVWITLENNPFSSCISHKITAMWSIINIISCNNPIYDVDSHPLYFYLFVLCYLSTPEELIHITMQPIIIKVGDTSGIILGKPQNSFLIIMFMLWHDLLNSEDLSSAPYSSTWVNANFLSLFLNTVTINLRTSRGGRLILDGNPKGYEVVEHIATKV